jgi:hypothetical protein
MGQRYGGGLRFARSGCEVKDEETYMSYEIDLVGGRVFF